MSRSIFDLDSIIERLCAEDPAEVFADPFAPDKQQEQSRKYFDAVMNEHIKRDKAVLELEDAAVGMALDYETAGFARGFKAGARLIIQLLQAEEVPAHV